MILSLYRGLTTVGGPLIRVYLNRRMARGKEDPQRFNERLGLASTPRPQGPLVWVHCASVGESISLLPLIERLLEQRADIHVMVTSGTMTSAKLLGERLPVRAFHQFVPVDRVAYIRPFLDHWKPDLALWAESEFWPNLLTQAAGRNIPLILINGRISPSSFSGWQRFPSLIHEILSSFVLCFGQTEGDGERLSVMGANKVTCVGNLKAAAPPLPANTETLLQIQQQIGTRPVFLAASTHPGEEQLIWQAHQSLLSHKPDLLTIIVPRHPGRGPEIAIQLQDNGAKVSLRSTGGQVSNDCQVYIADTMGELGLFFRLAGIVFMGKSLVPKGGQNPLEAARLDCAVLYGPHMANFSEMSDKMLAAGAALQVPDAAALAESIGDLLNNPDKRDQLANAGQDFTTSEAGVLDALCEELSPYLSALKPKGAMK